MFDGGELRLVILALVAEKPRYGYEIIKALGERVGGDYSPSPGVVYPTLTLIEEMGYASASQDEAGRKLYTVTPEGEAFLANNKAQVDAIFERLDGGNERPLRRRRLGDPRDDEPARDDGFACAAARRRPSRSRRSSTRSTRRPRRSSVTIKSSGECARGFRRER